MNSQTEHIFKGIGWYLYNGDFIEKNHNKISVKKKIIILSYNG